MEKNIILPDKFCMTITKAAVLLRFFEVKKSLKLMLIVLFSDFISKVVPLLIGIAKGPWSSWTHKISCMFCCFVL